MPKNSLPEWDSLEPRVAKGEGLDPLEQFIFDFEPFDRDDLWRAELMRALHFFASGART